MSTPKRDEPACRLLLDLLAGENPSPERIAEAEAHARSCESCGRLVAGAQEAGQILSRVVLHDPPERLLARLRRIPSEVFPCHRFAAAATELLGERETGGIGEPSGPFAQHLEACPPCREAWRVVSLSGKLPQIGPRRELFRLLASPPRRAARSLPLVAGRPLFARIGDRLRADFRWTIAVAYVAAMVVVVFAGDAGRIAKETAFGMRGGTAKIASRLPRLAENVPASRIEAVRILERSKALPGAYGKAYLAAIAHRVLELTGAVRTEPSARGGSRNGTLRHRKSGSAAFPGDEKLTWLRDENENRDTRGETT
jgi:hypothetical protein